jgi:hypothetical protein
MAKVHPNISRKLQQWIEQQAVFFLASAPLESDGHINLSPRGLDSLRVLNEHEVLVLDLTGSGNETAAHLAQNGRLTIMFCAFENEPRILRLYGQGRVILPDAPQWSDWRAHFAADIAGVRQLFHLKLTRVQTSCGFGVPLMDFQGQRDLLSKWAQQKGPQGVHAYQLEKNASSIDGLAAPGLGKATDK